MRKRAAQRLPEGDRVPEFSKVLITASPVKAGSFDIKLLPFEYLRILILFHHFYLPNTFL